MDSNSAIRAIRERINILEIVGRYVQLRQNGGRYVAPCPFHQETRPSFSVNPEKGFFYCFGCHASGDIFEFYSRINGLDFRETLAQLAEEAGITIDSHSHGSSAQGPRSDRHAMLRMNESACRHFSASLAQTGGAECRDYLAARGVSQETIDSFRLGWAPREWRTLADALRRQGFDLETAKTAGLLGKSDSGNLYDRFRGRLMFPILSLANSVVAFGGRIIADEDEAKYINTSDTPIYGKKEHLFGLARARRHIAAAGSVILTEGYMDVLTLHQYGYPNSVGVLGTALTQEQIRRISGFTSRVVLLFDGDRAGRKAALRSAEMLLARGLSCSVASLPDGEDIDSLLRSAGPKAFEAILGSAWEGLAYCADVLRESSPREAVDWARNFLRGVELPELASPFASRLSQLLQIDEKSLRRESGTGKVRKAAAGMPRMFDMRDTQVLIFAVRYPHRLQDLRMLGADLALASSAARELWEILEKWGPEQAFYHLSDQQKNFWQEHRGPNSAPLTDGEEELRCLGTSLASFYTASQKASLRAALAQQCPQGNFESDLEYLRALQATLEIGHE